jgi:DNA-binding MarR family transcriptional regulator
LTQVELAGRIGIEKASSTPVLDSLEAQRLIRRVRNKSDRRKSNVFLTPAGKALKASLVPHAVAVNALARRRLSARDLAAFIKVLETMVDNLRRIPEPERRPLARDG